MKNIFLFLFLTTLSLASCQTDDWTEQETNKMGGADHLSPLWLIRTVDHGPSTKAVGVKNKYWNPGDVIRIKFLSGGADFQAKVKECAAIWLEYANLNFEYVSPTEDADVKIGFGTENRWVSWSTIGTDCKLVPQNVPSLNFAWWDGDAESLIRSEVLRGIGHVLGLSFEHQNPNSDIVFKSDADIAGEYNLSPEEAEAFKQLYTTDQTNYSKYDKNSVMMLSIGRSLVVSPKMATTFNSQLSDTDKKFISELYSQATITATYVSQNLRIYIYPGYNKTYEGMRVDWGDGKVIDVPSDGVCVHRYADASEHFVKFYGPVDSYVWISSEGKLKTLDITRAKELERLSIAVSGEKGYMPIQSIDISQNSKLEELSLFSCKNITSIDLSNKERLTSLQLIICDISNLDLTGCPNLTTFHCALCPFNSIDFSPCQKIRVFGLTNNSNLDFQHIINLNWNNLKNVQVYNNNFPEIMFLEKLPVIPDGWYAIPESKCTDEIRSMCKAKGWMVVINPENIL